MRADIAFFVSVWLKFFFLFTPFFALSMFLSMTRGRAEAERRRLAWQVTGTTAVLCLLLFFFGRVIFTIFGITLDAFRVGAGGLLFLMAVNLAQAASPPPPDADEDISVVPLSIPVIVGPATTGTLLVLGAEITTPLRKGIGCLALLLAVACVGILLLLASSVERWIGRRGLQILAKITALVLAALAAQMILAGARHFFTG
jgi:multiple antibiotic resistance protein